MNVSRSTRKLKHLFLDRLPAISPAWGRVLLSRSQTIEILKPFEAYSNTPESVFLPAVEGIDGSPCLRSKWWNGSTVSFDPDAIWDIRTGELVRDLRILSTGNVILDGKFHLDLDFTPVKGLIMSHKVRRSEEALIACWPHSWGSYFDFVMLILAKLLRIEHALGPAVWKQARLAYPLRRALYEREFLQALGIDEDRVIDTRALDGAIGARQIVVANNHSWFYPSPDDVRRIRDRFAPLAAGTGKGSRRLYLARAGTRRVVNERDLRPILERFDVEFVQDGPRTLREQIDLFRSASLVVGPHGAAFTNITWTPPGAIVLELFNRAYFPPFFHYLARVLGHDYACWIEPGEHAQSNAARYDDLHVDPTGFSRLLEMAVSRLGDEAR